MTDLELTPNILYPVIIIDSQLIELSMVVDSDILSQQQGELELGIEASFHPVYSADGDPLAGSIQINLSVMYSVFPEEQKDRRRKKQAIIETKCTVRGIVRTIGTVSDDEEYIVWQRSNALSLMYSEIRAHIVAVSVLSPFGKVIIPPIDPVAYVRHDLGQETGAASEID